MRITTQPGTPAGNYVVYYHGIGDTVIRHASIDLYVGVPAFDLHCAQSDSVKTGDAVVDSVTVISRYYFNSPVTMILDSIRPAEPTISVSFDPNPVTPPPNGTIQTGMKITTQAGTPVWIYQLCFHAVGDTVIRRSQVALKVYGPIFDLSCVSSDSVDRGAFIVDSVTVSSRYNFSSPVTMTLDSIRPEEPTISVTFDPNPVTPPPNGSVRTGLRITTQSNTLPQMYRVYYRGTGNSLTRLSMVTIKVIGPSFDLHYSQSYSLSPGDTVRGSINVLSRKNFSSPVTMILDSIRLLYPSDTISVAFDPNPVTPPPNDSVSTQIRIETNSNLHQGYYAIYGHGSGGGVTIRFTIHLSVFLNTFDMIQVASAETLLPDASVVDSVYLYGRGYFSGWVTMAVDSIRPAEPAISVDFNPNPVFVPFTYVGRTGRRVTIHSGTPLGDYKVYCQGSAWGVTRRLAVSLKVVAQPFEVRSAPGSRVLQQWCASTDYCISVNSFVSYPVACTLSAAVVPPQSSIAISIVGDSVLSKSGYRNLGVRPNQEMTPGTYVIRVQARNRDWVSTLDDTLVYAVSYYLGPAMPSPSRGSTVISYGLPVESPASLKVYDLSGRLIRTLVSDREKAGYHKVSWDGRAEDGKGVSTGIYIYRLTAGSFSATSKLVVLK
jgi:hypothetical protein